MNTPVESTRTPAGEPQGAKPQSREQVLKEQARRVGNLETYLRTHPHATRKELIQTLGYRSDAQGLQQLRRDRVTLAREQMQITTNTASRHTMEPPATLSDEERRKLIQRYKGSDSELGSDELLDEFFPKRD
ncbi:MAG TPA: hypothetical protein VLF20_02790 [Patescibacteria group bacterium]|nr:hypothetical protein [Patescibacteria group bacterium]